MSLFVDLSHTVRDGLITYPGLPAPVVADHMSRADSRDGRYAPGVEFQIGRIEMVSNTGTYIDTPFHRYPDGHDLASVPLEAVAGLRLILIDAEGPAIGAAGIPDGDLTGAAVVFRTGWSQHWESAAYGDVSHPFVGPEALARLVAAKPALVGIDSVNIDDTAGGDRPVHTELLGAGIYVLEHLNALDEIDGGGWELFAVPVKVAGMGTFPVRAFARRS